MPVRLTVVFIQSPPSPNSVPSESSNHQRGTGCSVDAVLGELLGLPEIDLTLVNRLESISIPSTDHLTLESITGDMVVLDWQSPDQTCQSLRTLDIEGIRWPHPDDLDVVVDSTQRLRRIYTFDLRLFPNAKKLRESISRLHAAKQVKTFSLSAGGSSVLPISPMASSPHAFGKKGKGDIPPNLDLTAPSASPRIDASADTSDPLDDLVDQLDDFDP